MRPRILFRRAEIRTLPPRERQKQIRAMQNKLLSEALQRFSQESRSEAHFRSAETFPAAAVSASITDGNHADLPYDISGSTPVTDQFARGPYGKPYLPSVPQFHFNFTDSGDYVLLAYADHEVGVDLQQILSTRYEPLRIAQRFFTAEETSYLSSIRDPAEARFAFFRFWSIKEAYLKYLGVGLSGGMNRYEIVWDGPAADAAAPGQKEPPAAPGHGRIISAIYPAASFRELPPPEDGYCLALVYE